MPPETATQTRGNIARNLSAGSQDQDALTNRGAPLGHGIASFVPAGSSHLDPGNEDLSCRGSRGSGMSEGSLPTSRIAQVMALLRVPEPTWGHHGPDPGSAGETRKRTLGQWRSANAARSSGGGSFSAKCSSTLTIRPCRTSRKDTANREVSPSLISVTVAAALAHSSVRRTVQRQSPGQLSLRAMKFPGPRMRSCVKAFGTGGVDFSPRIRSGGEGRREDSAGSAPASFRS